MPAGSIFWSMLAITAALSACPACAQLTPAQYPFGQQLSAGKILVANEKLGDPSFNESVVLILQYKEDEGALGLVINHRTDLPLSRVFPDIKNADSDPVFMGGPVEITGGQALLRSADSKTAVTHILDDVYATGSKDMIEKSVAARLPASKFRLYLGYAGWGKSQLEAEIKLGAWLVRVGTPGIVFDQNPDSLWTRLIRESHSQMASNRESIFLLLKNGVLAGHH